MAEDDENAAPPGALIAPERLVIEAGGTGCLVLRGEIDAGNAWSLALVLDDPDIVRLDCAALTFLDAAGLRVLLRASETRMLTLRSPGPVVLRILDVTGLTGAFDIESSANDRVGSA